MQQDNEGSSSTQENKANNQGTSLKQKKKGDLDIIEDNQGSNTDQQYPEISERKEDNQGACQCQKQVDQSQMNKYQLDTQEDLTANKKKPSKKKGYGKKIQKIFQIVCTYASTISLIFFVIPQISSLNDQTSENYSQINQLYENDQIQKKDVSKLSEQIAEKDSQINGLNFDIETIQSKYEQYDELSQNFTKILSYPNSTPAQILSVIDMQKRIDLQSDQQKEFKAELYPMKEEWDIFKNDPSIIVKSWTEQFSDLKNDNALFKNSTSSEMQKLRDTFTYTVKPLNSTIEQLQIRTLTLQTQQTNTDQALTKSTNDLSTFKTSSNQFQQDQTTINSKLDSFYKFQQNSVEELSPLTSLAWANDVLVNGNGFVKLDKFQSIKGTVDSKTLFSITLFAHVNIFGGNGTDGMVTILNNSEPKQFKDTILSEILGSGHIYNNKWYPMSLFYQYIIEKGQSYDFAIWVNSFQKNIQATVSVHGIGVFITKQKIYTP